MFLVASFLTMSFIQRAFAANMKTSRFRSLARRCISWVSSKEIASLLSQNYPLTDPRSLGTGSKLKKVVRALPGFTDASLPAEAQLTAIVREWDELYSKKLHESAFEEMAEPGELNDGELPSWTRDRKKVELDPDYDVPIVSAHEAATRLKQK